MGLGRRIKNLIFKVRRKILRPKVLRRIVSEGNASPRLRNVLPEDMDARPVVYRIKSSSVLADTFLELEGLLKRSFLKLIEGKRVLIKYNLNTANPYPASVDPQMLKGVVEIMHRLGAVEVTAGDCCTISLIPTRSQLKKAGLPEVIKDRAKLICFDELLWVTVPLTCKHLKSVTIPLPATEAETIISNANLTRTLLNR